MAIRALYKAVLKVARTAPLIAALGFPRAGDSAGDEIAHLTIGQPVPLFGAPGADGRRRSLSDYAGNVIVLEWTSPVCPYTAAKYDSGAMQGLQQYAAAHHIVWLSIDTAAPGRAGYLTPAAAQARVAKLHAMVTAFLFDKDTRIARAYGAKTTPSFFLIDRHGKLAYQGSMDAEVTAADSKPQNYVRDALAALIAGTPVAIPETPQRGCAVEY